MAFHITKAALEQMTGIAAFLTASVKLIATVISLFQ